MPSPCPDRQNSVDTALPLMESTPKLIANMLKNGLAHFPELKENVQGYSEFEANGFACRNPHDVNDLLTSSFWRKFDPMLKTALDEIISSDKIDRSKMIDWLLLKYLNINSLAPEQLVSSIQSNAYLANPNPDSEDYQLHLYYLQPFRLFGITPSNRKFTSKHNKSALEWLWHANPDAGADCAPIFRNIIQIYILGQIVDLIHAPKHGASTIQLKDHLPKLKFKHHELLQQLIVDIENLYKASCKPQNYTKTISNKFTRLIEAFISNLDFAVEAILILLTLSAAYLLLDFVMAKSISLFLSRHISTIYYIALFFPAPVHDSLKFIAKCITSVIPGSARSFLKALIINGFKSVDSKLGTAFSQTTSGDFLIPENVAMTNIEPPITNMPNINKELKDQADKIFKDLGKLNQSFNLTPEVKSQIKDCLNKLNSETALSNEALKLAIEKAMSLLKNNLDQNEVSVMQQLIVHLQALGTPVNSSENIAIRMHNQQGYQPSITLLKSLHEKNIIRPDGSWHAPVNIPMSLQEKCKRIESTI